MSAGQGNSGKKDIQGTLKELLDFGPDHTPASAGSNSAPSDEVTARLKSLVEQIKEISRRIDNLSPRF